VGKGFEYSAVVLFSWTKKLIIIYYIFESILDVSHRKEKKSNAREENSSTRKWNEIKLTYHSK